MCNDRNIKCRAVSAINRDKQEEMSHLEPNMISVYHQHEKIIQYKIRTNDTVR